MSSPGSADGERAAVGSSLACPSFRCEPGAVLLGIVGRDQKVGYIRPELRIDESFVSRASSGRSPEKRFRFAGPCVEGRCRQWTGEGCGVIKEVLASSASSCERLPACVLRPHCRWYAQEGTAACRVCPLVLTDGTDEELGSG